MPYDVKENDGKFDVINKDTGEVKATHDTRKEADDQVKLLHSIENDPEWDAE